MNITISLPNQKKIDKVTIYHSFIIGKYELYIKFAELNVKLFVDFETTNENNRLKYFALI